MLHRVGEFNLYESYSRLVCGLPAGSIVDTKHHGLSNKYYYNFTEKGIRNVKL